MVLKAYSSGPQCYFIIKVSFLHLEGEVQTTELGHLHGAACDGRGEKVSRSAADGVAK